jgi:hypothetical protein
VGGLSVPGQFCGRRLRRRDGHHAIRGTRAIFSPAGVCANSPPTSLRTKRDAKLARIEHVTSDFPDRVFAFEEFGHSPIRPHRGAGWTRKGPPDRLPANHHKLHGARQFHGRYSVGEDTLWGVVRRRKSADNTLAALEPVRAARPDGAHRSTSSWTTSPPIAVPRSPAWGGRAQGRVVFHPDLLVLGQPDRSALRRPLRSLRSHRLQLPQRHRSHRRQLHTTCAGATPTPGIQTCSPPNVANAPASAAKRASGGRPTHHPSRLTTRPTQLDTALAAPAPDSVRYRHAKHTPDLVVLCQVAPTCANAERLNLVPEQAPQCSRRSRPRFPRPIRTPGPARPPT